MNKSSIQATVGGFLIGALLVATAIGFFWTPVDPMALNFAAKFSAPSAAHWLGTDEFGRDVASRLMVGARTSVTVSVIAVAFATFFGVAIGLLSGCAPKGWIDGVIMSINNSILAFPGILVALGLLAIFGASETGIILALSISFTPSMARVVRGAVLSLRERDFVEASRVMGNGELYTALRHVLPNCIAPIIVLATSMFGTAILSESALSFLGLGVPPPMPTWGNMLSEGRPYMVQAVWLGFFPGLCIAISLLAINLLGDALRDKLDPRMRGL